MASEPARLRELGAPPVSRSHGVDLAQITTSFVPRLNPTCNVRSLPLTPAEAFVLSRVDGFTSAADLGAMTGLGAEVLETLSRLLSLGAILGEAASEASARPASGPLRPPGPIPSRLPTTQPLVTPAMSPAPPVVVSHVPPRPQAASLPAKPRRYAIAELEEDVDIEPERRKRILDLFYSLGDASYYDLLGVEQTADKKQIKAAYFQLAQEFHPDRYFRKRLGNFGAKIEAVFKEITTAHDTLARTALRAEYDEQLAAKALSSSRSSVTAPPVAEPPSPEPASAAALLSEASTPPPPPVQVTARPLTEEERKARRQALASRLSGRAALRAPAEPVATAVTTASMTKESAREALRRASITKQIQAQRAQVLVHIKDAEEASARDDAVAAANAYELAASMSPDDSELRERQQFWAKKASVVLAASFVRQGDAEAAQARWTDAARSYSRAASTLSEDPELLRKAASALVMASGDLHQAADFARRAVALAPHRSAMRLSLAEVYLAANLQRNAKRELDAAAQLDPNDGKLKLLLKRLG